MDSRKSILVVDDSEFVRNYHSSILEQAGFAVLTAVDGNDGLEKLYTTRIDLVLTDINMRIMDGFEFIRRVRADERYRALPIIIVSTAGEGRDKMKGFEAGASLYMVKPSAPELMLEHVRMMLEAG